MPTSVMNLAARQALPGEAAVRQAADYVPEMRRNVGPTDRLISLGLGGCLTVAGLAARRVEPISLLAGGYLLYRGLTGNCCLYQALGIGTAGPSGPEAVIPARAGVKVEHSVTINKSPAEVYRFWRNLSQLSRFMRHLKEVRETGGNRSHWVARGPLGMSVEWDAELITDTPNETISWRSLDGSDIDTAGSVHFRPAAGGGTEVRVSLKYDPPAGKVGAAVARLFGESPEHQVRADLERFKSLMEGGATAGQGRGQR